VFDVTEITGRRDAIFQETFNVGPEHLVLGQGDGWRERSGVSVSDGARHQRELS
jgi:hypothetical protein